MTKGPPKYIWQTTPRGKSWFDKQFADAREFQQLYVRDWTPDPEFLDLKKVLWVENRRRFMRTAENLFFHPSACIYVDSGARMLLLHADTCQKKVFVSYDVDPTIVRSRGFTFH